MMSKQIADDCPPVVAEAIRSVPDGSEHMADGVRRYLIDGIIPGRFLTNVLANDLRRAAMYADPDNASNLYEWGRWLHNYVPQNAMGSVEVVRKYRGFAHE
jgi:hypothetical protein